MPFDPADYEEINVTNDLPLPKQEPRAKGPIPKAKRLRGNPLIPKRSLMGWSMDDETKEALEEAIPDPGPAAIMGVRKADKP